MFKRKLVALDYFNCDKFNFEDVTEFRSLVLWLEDQKIRKYKIQERVALRDIDAKNWDSAFRKYLSDLGYPFTSNTQDEIIDWLLGIATRIQYKSNQKLADGNIEQINATMSDNPLNNLDFNSADFKAGVTSLAALLKVPRHHNHLITLEAICKLVSQRLGSENIKEHQNEAKDIKNFPLKESCLGFDTGDYVLNEATKVLRLLYIKDLRDLQTKINEIIVAVQTITANPKIDSRLGKVGV